MSNDSKRAFINFLRGLAVFFMLWGHSIQYACAGQFDYYENVIFKLIYSFHMPLFMLLSGYLFLFSENKRGMIELIEYKSKALLYPILMCSIVSILLTSGISAIIKGKNETIIGGIQLTNLWFLWSVLACSIALAFAMKCSKMKIVNVFFMIIGIFFVALFPNWTMNVYMYPFFIIGYLYARNEWRLAKARIIGGLTATVGFIIMIFFYSKEHYIYITGIFGGKTMVESLKIDLFRWAIGLLGSVAVIWICSLIYDAIKNGKIVSMIEKLGRNSLAIYALSMPLLNYWLPKFMKNVMGILPEISWNRNIWFYNLIVTPFVAFLYSMFILMIIKELKKNNGYRLIFGRD